MKPVSRRQFLKTTALVAGFPTIIPSRVLGANAPSNRTVMGVIGTGGQGMNDMKNFLPFPHVQVVAVCDVDRYHRDAAKGVVDKQYSNTDCVTYNDFREITRRDDIDAVLNVTPDHWHVLISIDACHHRKDVYVEKPLTLFIGEGRELCNVVTRYGRVLQTGSQQRSTRNFRFAAELARNGRLGKLHTVEVEIPPNNPGLKSPDPWTTEPVPDSFDYETWLGQAPWQPYVKERCHYSFRFVLDYSGGQITNFGAHDLDIAQWGLGMDESGPVEIVGHGEFPKSGLFNVATKVDFTCTYSNGVNVTCKTGMSGVKFIGDRGWVYVNRGTLKADPPWLLQEVFSPDEVHLYESRDHAKNFLDCVRSRRKPVADVEIGHRSATICHLGNIAMLLGRKLKWDPAREQFIGDDSANAMLHRARRAPWDEGTI